MFIKCYYALFEGKKSLTELNEIIEHIYKSEDAQGSDRYNSIALLSAFTGDNSFEAKAITKNRKIKST